MSWRYYCSRDCSLEAVLGGIASGAQKVPQKKRDGKNVALMPTMWCLVPVFSQRICVTSSRTDYLERISKTGTCDWFYDPMWRGTRKNPNWFSQTAGSDGVHVRCETSAESADDREDQLVFEWDVSDYRGIEGFRWGYNPIQLDDEQ